MKRWFKLIGFVRVEGEIITPVEDWKLFHLAALMSFCQTGDLKPFNLTAPVVALYFREVLPAGLGPEIYWFVPPTLGFVQSKLYFRFAPNLNFSSPHEWPSSSS